jgi:hypothetical protein
MTVHYGSVMTKPNETGYVDDIPLQVGHEGGLDTGEHGLCGQDDGPGGYSPTTTRRYDRQRDILENSPGYKLSGMLSGIAR